MPDGTFAGYIGSCIDITDRKRIETELVKSVHDRDDFLSVASHELRTPLTTLQLEIEGMKRALEKRPETALTSGRFARSVEVAAHQTDRLIRLVEELLNVSRLAAGGLKITPVELDLRDLVLDVVERMRPSLEAARCELLIDA